MSRLLQQYFSKVRQVMRRPAFVFLAFAFYGGLLVVLAASVEGTQRILYLSILVLLIFIAMLYSSNFRHKQTVQRALNVAREFEKLAERQEYLQSARELQSGIFPSAYLTYAKRRFVNERVDVDGNTFHDCTFLRCRLVFRGTAPVNFRNCRFEDCEWLLLDSANLTLNYLSALYQGLGGEGVELVEGVFNRIRRGAVSSETDQPSSAVR